MWFLFLHQQEHPAIIYHAYGLICYTFFPFHACQETTTRLVNFPLAWHLTNYSGPAILVGLVVFHHRPDSKKTKPISCLLFVRCVDYLFCTRASRRQRVPQSIDTGPSSAQKFTNFNYCIFYAGIKQCAREKCRDLHHMNISITGIQYAVSMS